MQKLLVLLDFSINKHVVTLSALFSVSGLRASCGTLSAAEHITR